MCIRDSLNPGIKNIGKSRPEKSRDPGIWQNPVPKNPGIEILDPVRAWCRLPKETSLSIWGTFTMFPIPPSSTTLVTEFLEERGKMDFSHFLVFIWPDGSICF